MASRNYSVPLAQKESDMYQNSGKLAHKDELSLELSELANRPASCHGGGLFAAVREGSLEQLRKELGLLKTKHKLEELDSSGLNLLHQAARYNHHDVVRTLLNHGAQINIRSKEDLITPLHIACRFNCIETVRLLVERGADVRLRTSNGSTVLHTAARGSNREVAEILVTCSKLEINAKDRGRQTPLHMSCVNGDEDLCVLLLCNGADIRAISAEGKTPLQMAVTEGNAHVAKLILDEAVRIGEDVRELVKETDMNSNSLLHLAADTNDMNTAEMCLKYEADVNSRTANQSTPLHIAAARGNVNIARLLISSGANPEAKDGDLKTPLHRATLFNKVKIITLLLEEGVRIDPRDNLNRTPLLEASFTGQTQCATILLQQGAKADACDIYMKNCLHLAVENDNLGTLHVLLSNKQMLWNLTRPDVHERVPLHYAAFVQNPKVLKALLEKYEKCSFRDENQETPLHLAANSGIVSNVTALVQLSSGLNERDDQGRSPLHKAVTNGNRKVCSTLLRLGADVNIKDINMWSPLMLAASMGWIKCCQELLDRQASLNDVNTDGDTALHLASRYGHLPIVNLLMDCNANLAITNNLDLTFLGVAVKAGMCDVALTIVKNKRWPEMAEHKDRNGHPPLKVLIRHFPEAAAIVMDRSVQRSTNINVADPEYSIKYDFHLLDPGPDDPSFVNGKRFFAPAAMVRYGRKKLLRHPLTVELLKHKWSAFGRVLYYINFFSYILFVAMYSIFIITERERLRFVRTVTGEIVLSDDDYPNDDDGGSGSGESSTEFVQNTAQKSARIFKNQTPFSRVFSYLVLVNALFHIVKEIFQLLIKRFEYFTDINNLLEWILYVTTVIFMIPYTMPDKWVNNTFKQSKDKSFMWINGLISIFLCYVNLVLFLRRFRTLGIYVTMYVEVTKTVFKVLLVFSVFLLGFTIVFYVLFKEQESFSGFGPALIRVSVMMIGELEFKDTFVESIGKNNTETKNPLNPFPEAAFSFAFLFLFLMCIVLMNLLVGLAVGDIDSITQNATLKRLAMQVSYVAEIEETYPRFITRRLYKPYKVVRPNRPTVIRSFLFRIGMRRSTATNFALNDEESRSTEYQVMQDQISKTKKRVKSLVSVIQAQNSLLKLIAKKIDPDTEYGQLSLPEGAPGESQDADDFDDSTEMD